MKYYINGVVCDTYAYLDTRRAGDTVEISVSNPQSHSIIAFLYCDKKEFPVDKDEDQIASCCILSSGSFTDVSCQIGDHGEIIIPIPQELLVEGTHLYCEINITNTSATDQFIYRAFRFVAVVVR